VNLAHSALSIPPPSPLLPATKQTYVTASQRAGDGSRDACSRRTKSRDSQLHFRRYQVSALATLFLAARSLMRFQPIGLSENQNQPQRNSLKSLLSNFKPDFILFTLVFISAVICCSAPVKEVVGATSSKGLRVINLNNERLRIPIWRADDVTD